VSFVVFGSIFLLALQLRQFGNLLILRQFQKYFFRVIHASRIGRIPFKTGGFSPRGITLKRQKIQGRGQSIPAPGSDPFPDL
jgi:hypothetical protein